MAQTALAPDIVADLFYEQEHPLISGAYKHGFLRTLWTVARALFSVRSQAPAPLRFRSDESVAIVFFENEYQAAVKAQSLLCIDRIVRLDIKHLPIIRQTLGWHGLIREMAYFTRQALRRQGPRALSTLGVPMLGWLLYRTIEPLLRDHSGLRITTLNMRHPLSVGVFYGAKACRHLTNYVEHASTTMATLNDRGYDLFVVDLPHTQALLESAGIERSRIRLLRDVPDLVATPITAPIRTAGVCINDLDTMEAVRRVVDVLQELEIRVAVRVHDSDRRIEAFRRLAKERGLLFGSARESRIEAFFRTVDLVVAGNSNVLADALRAGTPAIHYWDGADDAFDYYGLAAHYAIPYARSADALRALLTTASVAV